MDKRVKDVAISEFQEVKALTKDAAYSGAYLYPIKVCGS